MTKNKIAARIFAFFAAALLLLFFSNDFGLIDIQKTSIVTAIGIDAGENGTLDITAQIAVTESGSNAKAGNVSVRGAQTVGEAIAELNLKTGWYPTLVHCRLILLGMKTAENNVFRALDYFLRSQFVEDYCLVAVCDGRAEDALGAQSPVGDMTYAAIEKVLSSEAQKTGLVSVNNLREFAKSYYAPGNSGFLPLLSIKKEAEDGSQNQPAQENSSQSADQTQNTGSDVFDASSTVLFSQGRAVGRLDAEQTLAFNLAGTDTDFAYGDISVTENGQTVTYNLKIKVTKKTQHVTDEEGVPVLRFTIRARAQVADASRPGSAEEVAQSAVTPPHVLRAAETKLQNRLDSVFRTAQASGCDLFAVRQTLQRFHPALFEKLGDSALSLAKPVYNILFDTLH